MKVHLVGRTLLLSLTLLCGASNAHGDLPGWPDSTATGKTHFLRGSYQGGHVLPSNDFVKGSNKRGEPIEAFQSARIEFGWQTDGAHPWQHLYNFPAYGIGFFGGDYFEFQDEIGNPSALYGFFLWPIKHFNSHTKVSVELGLGLSDDWKPWDPISNPNNIAIGAFRSIFIDAGAVFSWGLGNHWDIDAGIKGSHFSNGGTKKPNLGINQVGGSLGLTYRLGSGRPTLPGKRSLPPFDAVWEFLVAAGGGINNINFDTESSDVINKYKNVDYAVFNLQAGVNRQVGYMSKFGGGIDVTYDASVGAQIDASDGEVDDVTTSTLDKMALGLWGGYEQIIDRGSILLQLGYQVLRKDFDGSLPPFYQRLGIKYHVLPDTFVGLNVRFHGFNTSDYLEFNIGQRWLN